MGMWGLELYQNDTALDVKDEFEELFNAGKTAQEITGKLAEDYKSIIGSIDEEPLFWLALADTQWDFGVLLSVVKEKALYWINKDCGIFKFLTFREQRAVCWGTPNRIKVSGILLISAVVSRRQCLPVNNLSFQQVSAAL